MSRQRLLAYTTVLLLTNASLRTAHSAEHDHTHGQVHDHTHGQAHDHSHGQSHDHSHDQSHMTPANAQQRMDNSVVEHTVSANPSHPGSNAGDVLGPSPRDPMAINYYPSRRERPPKVEEETLRLPGQASSTATKPTKYHYYPHNQHIYLLPECAVQQVCNAVYVRLNYTQPLCACPSRYREPCSASLNSDDLHTTELSTDPNGKILTLVKTCEPVSDMRLCRSPRDWSLLALQNIRTGKSHYLVICRCPDASVLEGPMSHDQPTYASVPGIRVYGMMCVNRTAMATKRRGRPLRVARGLRPLHETRNDLQFPWSKVNELIKLMEDEEEEEEEKGEPAVEMEEGI